MSGHLHRFYKNVKAGLSDGRITVNDLEPGVNFYRIPKELRYTFTATGKLRFAPEVHSFNGGDYKRNLVIELGNAAGVGSVGALEANFRMACGRIMKAMELNNNTAIGDSVYDIDRGQMKFSIKVDSTGMPNRGDKFIRIYGCDGVKLDCEGFNQGDDVEVDICMDGMLVSKRPSEQPIFRIMHRVAVLKNKTSAGIKAEAPPTIDLDGSDTETEDEEEEKPKTKKRIAPTRPTGAPKKIQK